MATGTLHVWVLSAISREGEPMGEEPPPDVTCGRLVGGLDDPYDQDVRRLGDQVFFMPLAGAMVVVGVDSADGMVYVEGIDQVGRIHLAGCTAAGVPGDVAVALQPAGVFDCADSATEEGSPCDDEQVCTVDETCSEGRCQGGVPLDCSFVADACHGANCVEGMGCIPVPLPDGEPCVDGLFCTTGDVCESGFCRGAPLDCTVGIQPCETASCDEVFDRCNVTSLPTSSTCDDGLFCTATSSCDTWGDCVSTMSTDCSSFTNQCNTGICDEALDSCRQNPRTNGTVCNAMDDGGLCPQSDRCQVLVTGMPSTCVGARPDVDGDTYPDRRCIPATDPPGDCVDNNISVFPGAPEATGIGLTCSDGLDNDCDDFRDCADPACAGCGTAGCPCNTAVCACGTAACPSGVSPCP
jgi:hypothetical protein